jgi:multidrug efflux system outer membrane protein
LRLRPDVAQAEAQVVVQAAALGVARSDLLPQINLTGELVIADNLIGGQLSERTIQAQAAPSLSVPLFDWGRRMAVVRQRDAQFEQALVQYEQTVNQAAGEAERSLAALSLAQDRLASARRAEDAAAATARGARAAFEAGIQSLTDRLRADQQLIDAETARIEAEANAARAAIEVYRAFGGSPPAPPVR